MATPKLDEFMRKVSYHQMNFDDQRGLRALKQTLEQIDKEHGTQGQPAVLSGGGAGVFCRHHGAAGQSQDGAAGAGDGALHH